jgi:adenine C2-methylase RlmN of 23S rRNA A2503 and tRNA A37
MLADVGMQVMIQRELGSDISAACGQLRLDAMQESNG